MATQINASACLSTLPCENNVRYRIRKYERSKKDKTSTLAFLTYTSILMCSNNNSQLTTKSVASLAKDYKIHSTLVKYLSYSVFICMP